MALLAEQKRKVKFGLDPQNTSWSNDTSKFGQRLLEKMGWEKGKGLGSKEDGITQHIKASYKSDTKGLGCSPKAADAWIAHQDEFNDLLQMLNSQSEQSLEEKVDRADGRKRFYGRFARGQVPTLRSTEDLDCIFGRRKVRNEISSSKMKLQPPSEAVTCVDASAESSHGLTCVTSSSNVQEYFARKMAEMRTRTGLSNLHINPSFTPQTGETIYKQNSQPSFCAVSFSYVDKNLISNVTPTLEGDGDLASRGWYQNFLPNDFPDPQKAVSDDVKSSKKNKKNKKVKSDEDIDDNNGKEITKRKKKTKVKREMSVEYQPIDSQVYAHNSDGDNEKRKHKSIKKKRNDNGGEIFDYNTDSRTVYEGTSKKRKCENNDFLSDSIKGVVVSSKHDYVQDEDEKVLYSLKDVTTESCRIKLKRKKEKKKEDDIVVKEDDRLVYDVTEKKVRTKNIKVSDRAGDISHVETNKKAERQREINTELDKSVAANVVLENVKKKQKKTNSGEVKSGSNEKDTKAVVTTMDSHPDSSTNESPPTKSGKLNKVKKNKKKKKAGKKNAKSNSLFPGSNLTDIVGYGLNQIQGKKL